MSKYFCPYCSSRFQFHKTRSDGVLICGQCGDPMIKKTLMNSRQIFGLVAALAFLSPLILMIFFIMKDLNQVKPTNTSVSLVLMTITK